MNYIPKINRRSFVVGSAAAGGLALGFDLPFGRRGGRPAPVAEDGSPRGQRLGRDQARRHRRRSASPAPRWARARSPASPSWSPRSSNATGRRSRPNIRRPARTSQRKRVWGNLLDRRQPRHPRVARIRAQGRRGGAHDAACRPRPTSGRCRPPSARAANSVITHTASGTHAPRYGKVAEAAAKLPSCPRSRRSRTRRTGRSPASR